MEATAKIPLQSRKRALETRLTEPGTRLALIRDEAGLVATGLDLQYQGLKLLLAEMCALATILPGAEQRLPTDAEIEAGFDNMPI